jgi:GNAT superfamily N-acetyltransferase
VDGDAATTTVRVRPLRDGDRAAWDVLWESYRRFYRAELPDELHDATFARLRDGADGFVGLVAVGEDDVPVGLAHLVLHPSTFSTAPSCYLEDLFVRREGRGSGAARALFDAVFATARERGADRVYWHTQAYNGAARSLYDTVGRLTSYVVYEQEP